MSKACLLLHGYGGSPFEVEPICRALKAAGYHTSAPLLPGHGTSVDDFKKTFFPDWLGCAEKALLDLQKKHDQTMVIGFSMGGALALHLASHHNLAGVATLAGPVFTPWELFLEKRDFRLFLIPILRHILPYYHTAPARQASRDIAPVQGYDGIMCVPQMHSLLGGISQIRKRLHLVTCPLLIVNDLFDRHVAPVNALKIARMTRSSDISLHFTHIKETVTSHHMLPTHIETREQVAGLVLHFAHRIMG